MSSPLVLFSGGGKEVGSSTASIFTAAGTWTKPTGALAVVVMCIGGGGGGGTTQSQDTSCGAGGGGGYALHFFLADALPASLSVSVGAAGVYQSAGNGTAGGQSRFHTESTPYVLANGGGGGTGPTSGTGTGGAGGTTGFSGGTSLRAITGQPGGVGGGKGGVPGSGATTNTSLYSGLTVGPSGAYAAISVNHPQAANCGMGGNGGRNHGNPVTYAYGGTGGSGRVEVYTILKK